MMLYEIW